MPLVLTGTVVPFDTTEPRSAAIYVDDNGRIETVQGPADSPPAGYAQAPRIDTGSIIYPGLVDLHNHLAYNLRSLWTPPRQAPYQTRYQWPKEPSYHTEISAPAAFLQAHAPEEALKYVEVKALTGGVTTIQGLSSNGVPAEGWLIHHTEFEKRTDGKKATFQSVLKLSQAAEYQAARNEMTAGSAFIYHLSEGTAPSLTSEFDDLDAQGCVLPKLVAIHATALAAQQYGEWKPEVGSVVWSPLSNLWLYRATTDIPTAHAAGVRLCLGSDWSPSGSKHVLGELKVADFWNTNHLAGLLSDRELCQMVTSNPADAVDLSDHFGRIQPGLRADLLVMPQRAGDPYRNLIQCTERDTALVLVAGRPVYGTPALMAAAQAQNIQPVGTGGLTQVISLPDPTNPTAHLSWHAIVTRLQSIQANPSAAQTEALTAGVPMPSFQLLLDMPWDEPAPRVDRLAEVPTPVTVPPLDSLVHDGVFFGALQAAPILDGLLSHLQETYYPGV
jgi:5-methylthioadenosine/S-adenosylhomocysteine deaminase